MNTCAYCEAPIETRRGMAANGEAYLYACPACLNVSLLRRRSNGLWADRLEAAPDIRETLPMGSIPAEILARLRKAADDLPLLPEVCQRVVSLAHDPLATMGDMADAINQDPVIATKLLKLANSVAFGGIHEVKNLDQACARLGIKEIVHTVQAVAYSGLYRAAKPAQRETLQALWRHTIATAQAAHEIARKMCPEDADELFLAGLLHDLGAVILTNIIAQSPVTLSSRLREEPELAHNFEVKYHALAGIHVVSERSLPNTFAFTTYFHPNPEDMPIPQSRTQVLIVRLAERIAEACGYEFDGGDEVLSVEDPEISELGLSSEDLEALETDVKEKVESLLEVMAV
ncbi:MAG: HDOD domain-containing protein [Candidatus Hydrogenedentota bacterium]